MVSDVHIFGNSAERHHSMTNMRLILSFFCQNLANNVFLGEVTKQLSYKNFQP